MSTISNFRKDKVDLPIGSVKVIVSGNTTINATANTEFLVENGTWIRANSVYAQSAYPELYSQLGKINAGAISKLSDATLPTWFFIGNHADIAYGNGVYVISSDIAYATSTNLTSWTIGGSRTTVSITNFTYGNGLYVYSGFGGVIGTSSDLLNWTARTSGTTSTIYGLTYGAGLYVYGAVGGVIRTSTDGITWIARTSGTTSQINSIMYNNGLFVAGGVGGNLRTSTDGITWTARTSGTASLIASITYGNSLYLLCGAGNTIRTSTDAITWTARTSGAEAGTFWYSIGYGNGLYVVGGDSTFNRRFRTSTDGITWTAVSLQTTIGQITSVGYGNGTYFSMWGGTASSLYYTSNTAAGFVNPFYNDNGHPRQSTMWTAVYQNGYFLIGGAFGQIAYTRDLRSGGRNIYGGFGRATPLYSGHSITYGQGKFISIGSSSHTFTSTDNGVNWNVADIYDKAGIVVEASDYSALQGKVQYLNGSFYLMARNSILSSTDGADWRGRVFGTSDFKFNGFSYGNGIFLVSSGLGLSYSNKFNDASTFDYHYPFTGTTSTFQSTIYGNGRYVAAGNTGVVISTKASSNVMDVDSWVVRTSGTTSTILSLTYGNSVFVYGGFGGVLQTSTDSETWTARTSGTTSTLRALTYGNSLYVYDGDGGVLATSTDGITWTARTSGTTSSIFSLTYGNGLYLYGGNGGVLATSTNGIAWSTRNTRTSITISTLVYGNGLYFYASNEGSSSGAFNGISSSTDGISWFAYNAGHNRGVLSGFAYGAGKYVVSSLGDAPRMIAISDDFNAWDRVFVEGTDSSGYNHLMYNSGYFIACTLGNRRLNISKDGLKWNYLATNSAFSGDGRATIYSNGSYVVYGLAATDGLFVSVPNSNILLQNSWMVLHRGHSSIPITSALSVGTQTVFVGSLSGSTVTTAFVGVAANVTTLGYSGGYDANTNFAVPDFTNTGAIFVEGNASTPHQQTFVKAKM